jgi:hypothetical protein
VPYLLYSFYQDNVRAGLAPFNGASGRSQRRKTGGRGIWFSLTKNLRKPKSATAGCGFRPRVVRTCGLGRVAITTIRSSL